MNKFWRKILYYLDVRTLFRPDAKPITMNVKFMNGMNRVSILMFIFAVVVMTIRYCSRS